jgi:hypothetical protein
MKQLYDKLVRKARDDSRILCAFLFGSLARQDSRRDSDADICLVLRRGGYSSLELSRLRLEYLELFDGDVQIFQQLPLYIRIRIVREGKVLFCQDIDELYKVTFDAIREFDYFADVYRDYLKEVADVR